VVSMSVTTRFAVSADFNFVWQGVEEICMIDAFPSLDEEEDEKAARKAIREKRVLVAEVNGVPAGFLWFVFSKKLPWGVDYGSFKKTFAYSNYVFVGKRFRKKGVGKLLYKEFEGVCKRRGVREIFLDVFWTNSRSRKFHGKTGFKPFTVVYSKKLI
jgi:GNAT superfamily N-acetyltransferase